MVDDLHTYIYILMVPWFLLSTTTVTDCLSKARGLNGQLCTDWQTFKQYVNDQQTTIQADLPKNFPELLNSDFNASENVPFQEHNKENILQNGQPKVDLQKIFTPATDTEEIKPARMSE